MTVSDVAGGERRTVAGTCLCGAVRFTCTLAKDRSTACHCGMCRRWSGGVHIALGVDDLAFEDEAALGVYRSSPSGERVFCTTCGSSLAWRSSDGRFAGVSLYALEPAMAAPLGLEIFIDDKPDDTAFAGDLKRMTGAEVAALFAEGSE